MKAVKGKVLKKIKAIGYLKPELRILPLAIIQEHPETIDVTEPMKTGSESDKENTRPPDTESSPSFKRPDLNSTTLFDPNLLAAFEQAVSEAKSRCPPGGIESIVLYTTGIRGIRKTFEDCQRMRSLLENLKVEFFERDISMHSLYKEELWRILGESGASQAVYQGRYIGGAQEVLGMHEQGKLKPLIEGIPVVQNDRGPCQGCVGFRFVVCFNCNGSRRILEGQCSECNENGVIVCPFCCS